MDVLRETLLQYLELRAPLVVGRGEVAQLFEQQVGDVMFLIA